jgi:hypothetical protein
METQIKIAEIKNILGLSLVTNCKIQTTGTGPIPEIIKHVPTINKDHDPRPLKAPEEIEEDYQCGFGDLFG